MRDEFNVKLPGCYLGLHNGKICRRRRDRSEDGICRYLPTPSIFQSQNVAYLLYGPLLTKPQN